MAAFKKIGKLLYILIVLAVAVSVPVSAKTSYQTYTYSYAGDVQISPNAYTPVYELFDFGMETPLNKPQDMAADAEDRIAIADTGNSRIVILNNQLKCVKEIKEYIGVDGNTIAFNEPKGVFIRSDGLLYVADTGNANIVVFDKAYNQIKVYPAVSADILPKNFVYSPKSLAVDHSGRMYVISENTNMGVISLDKDGALKGFIGAQRVNPTPGELLLRMFMSEEQIERSAQFVPMEYSNITIDDKGFLYVTSGQIDRYALWNSVWTRSSKSTYAPLKKINTSGTDVLRRNGFFPPVGDINFDSYEQTDPEDTIDPSQLDEVALMENGVYMVVDKDSNKMFAYDSYGNLLYAFGGTGQSLGLYTQLSSVVPLGERLLALDTLDGSVTVLERTEYGRLINTVIGHQERREFDKAQELWNKVLEYNNNFDLAYLGIGKTYLETGNYKEAIGYFKLINNKTYYSKAYKLLRTEQMEHYGILVMLGVVAAIVGIAYFFGFAKRYNNKCRAVPATGRLRDELFFGFYTMFHPFYGFYELKHEKRGSKRAATVFVGLAVIAVLFQSFGSAYLMQSVDDPPSVIGSIANIILPVALWCVANWCLTSLMDGKGSISDIYVATAYSLLPMIIFTFATTFISHFLIIEEISMLQFASNIGMIWTLMLVFLSMINTHDYSLGRNVAVTLLSIVVIGIILFLLMILFSLSGRMVSLVSNIIEELSFRS